MKTQRDRIVIVSCLALGLLGVTATLVRSADEAPKASDEEQQKMMEMWMKLAQPGPEHARLKEQFAGEWTAEVQSCGGDPGGPMVKSEATMENRMLMGDRYLGQEYNGTMMETEYHGMGMMGYDNAIKKYIGAWIDNMSTGLMTSEGAYDESTKTYTLTGTFNDPSQPDGKGTMRQVIKVTDNDHHQMLMYMKGPDGKEMLVMDARYTRKK